MRFKNLLVAAFATCVSFAAAAFPSYTLSPASGGTYDDAYYLSSINVVFSSNVKIQSGVIPTLTDQQGNVYNSTEIRDFSAMQKGTYIVKFDESQFKYNGEYKLSIPAGTFYDSGTPNEEIVANYTLNSRYLTNPGEAEKTYDPITLISCDPEENSVIMGLGNVAGWVNTISFNTSNNSAVNYIGWELWDVTDPENPLYVYQGNENRIDTNRNGSSGDYWGSTPKISIGGEAVRMMQGHTFEMKLVFAGIGYDPVSNQYPSPVDIETSKLLETSVYFQGGMAPPVYSPYEVTYVSPGDGYTITNPEFSFLMSYSGPVKPTTFTYFNGPGDSPTAGSYKAMSELDENGCANVWQFTFYNGILQEVEGTVMVNIIAKDADGKTVKGSGDYDYENNIYNISFLCDLGAESVTLSEPTTGVTALSSIVVSNSSNKAMTYMSGTATISKGGQLVRTLGEPEAYNSDNTMMKWTFDAITDAGEYVLNIPASYFSIGDSASAESMLNLVVIGGAYYDIAVTDVTPAAGSNLTEFYNIEFGAPADTQAVVDSDGRVIAKASVYSVSAGGVETLLLDNLDGDVIDIKGEDISGQKVNFVFGEEYTEPGQYRVKVERGLFGNAEYVESVFTAGRATEELSYDYFVTKPASDPVAGEGEPYLVDFNTPIDTTVEDWVVEEGWGRIYGWFEDAENYPDKGTFEHRVDYTHNTAGGKYDSGYLTAGNQNYKSNDMWFGEVHVNDMLVTPLVKGKMSVWVRAAKLPSWLITAAKIRVFEINEDGSKGDMIKELDTSHFGYSGDTPDWEEVVLLDPAKDAQAADFKKYGLSFSNMDVDDLSAEAKYVDAVAPTISVVTPETMTSLESLSEIIIGNSEDYTMEYAGVATPARIMTMQGGEVRTLSAPVAVEGNPAQMKFAFEPITDDGSYILDIPEGYFKMTSGSNTFENEQTGFRFFVEAPKDPATYDLQPTSVTPNVNEEQKEIKELVLTFGDVTFVSLDNGVKADIYKKVEDGDPTLVESVTGEENDWFSPTSYTFTLSTPITDKGIYTVTFPKGTFFDETYDMEGGQAGHASPELTYTFVVSQGTGVANIMIDGADTVTVYTLDGVMLLNAAPAADFLALPEGIYIVNGKKIAK